MDNLIGNNLIKQLEEKILEIKKDLRRCKNNPQKYYYIYNNSIYERLYNSSSENLSVNDKAFTFTKTKGEASDETIKEAILIACNAEKKYYLDYDETYTKTEKQLKYKKF